jgi:hypothetical protein
MPKLPRFKPTPFVKDDDLGFRKQLGRLLEADGLEIRAGWLTGRHKYDEDRGGTAIAKVAGVQFGFSTLGEIWDQNERRLDSLMGAAEKLIVDNGANANNEILKIGLWLAGKIADRVRAVGLVDEGVMIGNIRVGLYARSSSGTGFGRPKLVQEYKVA